jgi:hypothetical protein
MKKLIIIYGLTASLAACGGDGGDGAATIKIGLKGEAGASAPTGRDQQGSAFTFSTARAYIRHIELDLPDDKKCADLTPEELGSLHCDSDKLRLDGPFAIDLMTGEATPSLAGINIPAGVYKRVDIRFDDVKPDDGIVDASDPLQDNTMVATGSFDNQGSDTPFELVLKFNEDARFESPEGIEVTADAGEFGLWLDVAQWFRAIPVTQCIDDGDLETKDGTLMMQDDRGSCSDIENALKNAIKTSGQLDRGD